MLLKQNHSTKSDIICNLTNNKGRLYITKRLIINNRPAYFRIKMQKYAETSLNSIHAHNTLHHCKIDQ